MNYFLALGSNVQPRIYFIDTALVSLRKFGDILEISDLYESDPYGVEQQDSFINMVCKFSSSLSPYRLLRKLKESEAEIGRKRTFRWGPREIDMDIMDWDGPVIESAMLSIPHKGLNLRRFMLIPLQQIAADFRSRSGKDLAQLIGQCPDKGMVTRYKNRVDHGIINA